MDADQPVATATAVDNADHPQNPVARATTGWRTVTGATICLVFGPSVLTVLSFGAFIAPRARE